MKQPLPDLAELMESEDFRQRYAKVKEQMEAMDAVKNEEKCLVLFERAMAALEAGDRRGWRRRMTRVCELSGMDPAQYGL